MSTSSYQILKGFCESSGKYGLSPIQMPDAEPIRKWRNEQISALRQSNPLSKADQATYFNSVIKPSFSAETPSQILLRFTYSDKLIGYGGLVHLNWSSLRGEVSFLLDTERTRNVNEYCKDLFIFLKLLKKCAFHKLCLNKISTYSYSHRAYHVDAIEKAGFTREGVLREDTQVDGKWVDAILASCLRSEFEKSE